MLSAAHFGGRGMNKKKLWMGGLGAVALAFIGFGAWLLTLPATPAAGPGPQISNEEVDATLAGLKPPKRQRPLIAIVGINDSTEITDYLVPYGILRRADVADVVALATGPGAMRLYPAEIEVEPQGTIADFDAKNPDGADYVIVPQMSRGDDPAALEWIRSQAAKKAIVIGICAGARIVANTGLLDGKRATTHWFYVNGLREQHPELRYVADRRLVVDAGVATTTGITASMPMMLTLIEAISGREKAQAVAQDIGVRNWDARHNSDAFKFTRDFAITAMGNRLPFWRHEQLGLQIAPGVDEVSLALVADAWSRTYRSRTVTFADTPGALQTRSGISIIPGRVAASWPAQQLLPAVDDRPPAAALDATLDAIATRYGERTSDFVAMQLEYPVAQP
jgi:putative intracellular protease/amidase